MGSTNVDDDDLAEIFSLGVREKSILEKEELRQLCEDIRARLEADRIAFEEISKEYVLLNQNIEKS